ncbi:MAG TPA: PAS domain S-box protein, partial [Anaerolineales bacterium]|nr:PAS domain S-box protein [Anaerolineales bacterium]
MNRAAEHLKFVFRITQGLTAVMIALNLIFAPNLARVLAMAAVFTGTWLLYGMIEKGKFQLACWLFITFHTAVVLWVISISGGVKSPAMSILVLFNLLSGVLLGGWGGIGFTGLSLLVSFIFVALEQNGRLVQTVFYTPVDTFLAFSLVLVASMTLLFSVFSNLRRAIEKATLEGDERFQAETERRKAEEKLLNIERRYAALFEAHTDGIFFIGLNGIILESNQRATRMLGYELPEILGQHVNQFVASSEHNNLSDRIASLRRGEKVPLYERRFVCKDGHLLPTEVNAMMVYNQDGEPQGIQSIIRDISERKRNENALHTLIHQLENQRTKIETALEVSKATISILDPVLLSQKIVDLVKERFGFYYVGLFLLSEDKTRAILRAGTGTAGEKMLSANHSLPVGDGSMIGWSIANKTPRIALDVGLDAVRFGNPVLPETRSEMALPLLVR